MCMSAMAPRRGFTLTETMFTVIILGIMATAVVLPYMRTLERGKWSAARDVLESIYAGERVFEVANGNFCAVNPGPCTWPDIYVDDPTNLIVGVTFNVTTPGGNMRARATRGGTGPCVGRLLELDETRAITAASTWPEDGAC